MLLFQSVMLASLASVVHATPVVTPRAVQAAAPIGVPATLAVQAPWRELQLAPPCGHPANRAALPCFSIQSGHGAAVSVLTPGAFAPASFAKDELRLPRKNDTFRSLGGFVHLDVVASPKLRSGPELSWSSPDSPREDLQKMRLLAPGWGLRYVLADAPMSVGVSACSRIVMMGKQMPMVDPLTSEARVEFRLP